MTEQDNRVVVRYNSEGKRIQRLPLHTILNLPTFTKWYNEVSRHGLVAQLNTGNNQPLPDGGWLELEKKD
jgi:hypothetical protein